MAHSASAVPSPSSSPLPDILQALNNSLSHLSDLGSKIPGSAIAWRYFKASHQDDPFRTLLEIALIFFVIRTYAQSRTKGEASGKNFVKLSEKEIDELVEEWVPEPLLPPAKPTTLPPIIVGATGPRPRVIFPSAGQDPHDPHNPLSLEGGKQVVNLASANFSGLAGNERIRDKVIECLKRYGVGSCGPSGFYGTFDVHLELERDLSVFLSVPAAIIYAHSFSTISSVIPSFSKRGDIIVADRGVNFAIQKGIQISRSTVRWYEHGDYEGLERVLEGIRKEDKRYGRKPTASRRFIVTEGVFENDGSMVDLPKIMELKMKYKYRLMLDESWSFGTVGKTGRGVTEVFDIPAASVDIMTGSMAIGLGSGGGFCVGSHDVVAHQRINSPSFVFSAALPPLLAVSASESLALLSIPLSSTDPAHPLSNLPENVRALRAILDGISSIEIPSAAASPMIHIYIKPLIRPGNGGMVIESSREEQERLLQEVVDNCADNGVLITRSKRNWEQEIVEHRPSIRICVTSALSRKEVEKAGTTLKQALVKVLGKVAPITVGSTIPSAEFNYVPYSAELEDPAVCGLPSKINTDSWKGKKVVIFGVPGAFTKTCSENHLPPYVEKYDEFKSKGVDSIYCIASNDMFVMSAWGRVMKSTDKVICISDSSLKWLEAAGLTQDLSHVGFGVRSSRFAMIVDDLKVTYVGVETGPGVAPSGAEAVLAKL